MFQETNKFVWHNIEPPPPNMSRIIWMAPQTGLRYFMVPTIAFLWNQTNWTRTDPKHAKDINKQSLSMNWDFQILAYSILRYMVKIFQGFIFKQKHAKSSLTLASPRISLINMWQKVKLNWYHWLISRQKSNNVYDLT